MPRTDLGDTLQARRFGAFSYVLAGTLAAQDYLGDTGNDTGLTMPGCTVTSVHVNAGTASGTDTNIQLENEATGETVAFTPDADEEVDIADLDFGEGDGLSIAVTGVDGTTAGSDVSLALEYELDNVA